jgi:hypothetical protein
MLPQAALATPKRSGFAAQNSAKVSFWIPISWAATSRSARYQ